ncbi:hypothetical protein SAMN05421780_10144 [Flexibacter flexilis DSM 6793]|uniref:Uncharacterized protein n=1 Tax=Flexibacter flexilis DSM 6793 TaxID=927664 RepID=A0A1I1D871_9BACT|nr:hypothetical protein SAMN05421780_10144 [Flexibacter flexilis DSM 6793]
MHGSLFYWLAVNIYLINCYKDFNPNGFVRNSQKPLGLVSW